MNLGLQCVGMMRKEMAPEDEANCNSMVQLRKVAESKPNIVQAVQDSIHYVSAQTQGQTVFNVYSCFRIKPGTIMARIRTNRRIVEIWCKASDKDIQKF